MARKRNTKKTASAPKRMKPRSPEYPAITLERAVHFVRVIYQQENKSEAATPVILRHMGYSEGSGAGFTTLAAMRKFGLLEGRHGKYRLTGKALDIAIADPASEEFATAIQQAALSPAIHRDIWKKYEGVLPSEANLRYYLERERGFTGTAIKRFIPQFCATLEYAGVQPGQDIADQGAEIEMAEEATTFQPRTRPVHAPPPLAIDPGALPLPIAMEDGTFKVVSIPKMTAKAFDFFKKQLDSYRDIIVSAPTEGDGPPS